MSEGVGKYRKCRETWQVVDENVVYRGLHRCFLLTVLLLWNGLDVLHEKIIQEL